MSLLRNVALWLMEMVSLAAHWLARSWWSLLLALILLLLSGFWIWMADRRSKQKLSKKLRVKSKLLHLGPIHAEAGWVVLIVAAIQLVLNVFARVALSGPAAYGPHGWFLSSFWMDALVPLPYSIAFPAGLLFYGYLYSLYFLARAETLSGLHSPVAAWAKAAVGVPFLPLTIVASGLLSLGIRGRRWLEDKARKRKQKKAAAEKVAAAEAAETSGATEGEDVADAPSAAAENESPPDGGGEGEPSEAEAPEEDEAVPEIPVITEVDLLPPELDGTPRGILRAGHEHRRARLERDPELDDKLLFFRLFPRHQRAIRRAVPWAFLFACVASIAGYFNHESALSVSFPDEVAFGIWAEHTPPGPPSIPLEMLYQYGEDKGTAPAPTDPDAAEDEGEDDERRIPAQLIPNPFVEAYPSIKLDEFLVDFNTAVAEKTGLSLPEPLLDALGGMAEASGGALHPHELKRGLKWQFDHGHLGTLTPAPVQVLVLHVVDQRIPTLEVEDPGKPSARYSCSYGAYKTLEDERNDRDRLSLPWAKATVNAVLCKAFMDATISFDALTSWETFWRSVTAMSLEDLEYRRIDLHLLQEALQVLRNRGSQLDRLQGLLLGGLIYREWRQYHQAFACLREAVDIMPSDSETGAGLEVSMPFGAVVQLCDLLARLNRFDEGEEILAAFAGKVEALAQADPEQELYRLMVSVNVAAYQAMTFQRRDASEGLDALLQARTELREDGPLVAGQRAMYKHAAALYTGLLPEPKNTRLEEEVFIFGAIPAGPMAAILLFLLALLRSVRTPLSERTRRAPQRKAPEPLSPPRESLPIEKILKELKERGDFDVSDPFERWSGYEAEFPSEEPSQEVPESGPVVERDTGGPIGESSFFEAEGGRSKEATTLLEHTRQMDLGAPEPPPPATQGADEPPAKTAAPPLLDQEGRPVVDFLRVLLRERGYFSAQRTGGLYRHQTRCLELLDEARGAVRPTTVLLAAPSNSGKTTTALAAAMETIIEHGESVLYLMADSHRVDEHAAFFSGVRETEGWSWNLRAFAGVAGIDRAITEEVPIHLLFADLDLIHRKLLPTSQQNLLSGYLQTLGLIVVEDLDTYTPAALAHASFILRRLSEVLRVLDRRPAVFVSTTPVMADDENLARDLLGPLASNLRLVPDSSNDTPEPDDHRYYVLEALQSDPPRYPLLSREHMAAAIIQAAGVREGDEDGAAGTTWSTCLVGYGGDVTASEDRALKVYYDMGQHEAQALGALETSRASLFPLRPGNISRLDAETRYAGLSPTAFGRLAPEDLIDVEGKPVTPEEILTERREFIVEHTTFLLAGPEPVDRFLARRFSDVGGAEGELTYIDLLQDLKPEWPIPRRNRGVNTYHFSCTLQERPSPGQLLDFLEDMFEEDVLAEMVTKAARKGLLDAEWVPAVDRKSGQLEFRQHLWGPRDVEIAETLDVESFSGDRLDIVDRVTHQQLLTIERCRGRAVFYPGRIFIADGVRYQIVAQRYQKGLRRGEWFCEPFSGARHSAPIRRLTSRPELKHGSIDGQWHSIGHGRPFVVAFLPKVHYSEEILGCRIFSLLSTIREATEKHEPQNISFETEALVLGFDQQILEGWDDPSVIRGILHGATLLLRQTLPLVLRIAADDLEIGFGVGTPGLRETVLDVETNATIACDGEEGAYAFIAFYDHMQDGLGYARFLHERLLQSGLFKSWVQVAIDLGEWGAKDEDPFCAVRTTLNREPVEVEEARPAEAVEFLRRLIGAVGGEAAGALTDRETDKGLAARRGLTDLFALESGEETLADGILPEFSRDTDVPWGLAFLCVLQVAFDDPERRLDVERLAMAALALEHRDDPGAGLAPPVGLRSFALFHPKTDALLLEEIPYISDDPSRAALEVTYGDLARAMGLLAAGGGVTERGCALARALLQAPGFRAGLQALEDDVRRGNCDLSTTRSRICEALHRASLPDAARRVLRDGLSDVPSIRRLGEAWRQSIPDSGPPRTIDRQLERLAGGATVADGDVQRVFEELYAYHQFDRALGTAVAVLRVELSRSRRAHLSELGGATGQSLHEKLGAAAGALLGRPGITRRIPRDVHRFAQAVRNAESSAALIQLLVERMTSVCGEEAPLTVRNGYLVLARHWEKKRPRDDRRGLLFRLNCVGAFLSETGWWEGVEPMGLSTDRAVRCDASAPLPVEWSAALELPPDRAARGVGDLPVIAEDVPLEDPLFEAAAMETPPTLETEAPLLFEGGPPDDPDEPAEGA